MNTRLAWILGAAVVIWLPQAFGREAAADAVGVFRVFEFKAEAAPVAGACFLIDKEYGWLLTAAHVVKRCHCDSLKSAVYVRPCFKLGGTLNPIVYEPWLECTILAYGHNFVDQPEPEGNTNDWVLLKIRAPIPGELISLFTQYSIDANQTPPELEVLARAAHNDWSGELIGFPLKSLDLVSEPAWFASTYEKSNGLWEVAAQVSAGNSGGPFVNRGTVIGIVLKVAEANTATKSSRIDYQSEILPTYSFLSKLSSQVPATPRVQNVLKFFSSTNDPQTAISIYCSLKQLNALEHYQVLRSLCGQKDEKLQEFVYDLYAAYFVKNAWVLKRLLRECNDVSTRKSLCLGAARIADTFRKSASALDAARLTLAQEVSAYMSSHRDTLMTEGISEELLAQATLDDIYLRRHLYAPAEWNQEDSFNIAWASARLPNSPDVAVAYLDTRAPLALVDQAALAQYAIAVSRSNTPTSTSGRSPASLETDVPRNELSILGVLGHPQTGISKQFTGNAAAIAQSPKPNGSSYSKAPPPLPSNGATVARWSDFDSRMAVERGAAIIDRLNARPGLNSTAQGLIQGGYEMSLPRQEGDNLPAPQR